MKINVTTTIDAITHQSAKDNDISWSDALEFGVKFLIAEKEGFDYPENNLSKKIAFLTGFISDQSKEIESLKTDAPVIDQVNAEQEVDDLLKGQLVEAKKDE
jgi:hypothetical protein